MPVIDDLLTSVKGDFYRPNLYQVFFYLPTNGILKGIDLEHRYNEYGTGKGIGLLCITTSIPESEIQNITVPILGREVYYPTDHIFPTWTVTVIESADLYYHKQFHKWQDTINDFTENKGNFTRTPNFKFIDLCGNVDLALLSRANDETNPSMKPVAHNYIYNIWPTIIGAVDLNYETADAVASFTVDFKINGGTSKLE